MSALEAAQPGAEPPGVNEVRLVGRLGTDPEERELPSGEVVWTFRITVPRPAARGQETGPGADSLDCTVRAARPRRTVATWAKGDLVEVSGSVRKRFFRVGGATAARVDVEVTRARVIRRAGSG